MNTQNDFSDLKSSNVCIRKSAPTAMFDVLILTSVTVVKETPKAILVSGLTNSVNRDNSFMGGWIAKSILTVSEDGTGVTLTLPTWYNNKFEVFS